jgi:hypothetical protein
VDEWELYDLETDPNEMENVYDDPEYELVRNDLHEKLTELRASYKDSDSLTQSMLEEDLKRITN